MSYYFYLSGLYINWISLQVMSSYNSLQDFAFSAKMPKCPQLFSSELHEMMLDWNGRYDN